MQALDSCLQLLNLKAPDCVECRSKKLRENAWSLAVIVAHQAENVSQFRQFVNKLALLPSNARPRTFCASRSRSAQAAAWAACASAWRRAASSTTSSVHHQHTAIELLDKRNHSPGKALYLLAEIMSRNCLEIGPLSCSSCRRPCPP